MKLIFEALPADVTTDDDITAEDGTRAHILVDGEGNDRSVHGELDRARVDDADDVAGSRRRKEAEEWAVAAVLGVEFDHLLVVVRALEELEPRVERPAVRVEEHLHAVDRRVEGVRAEGA